MDNTQNNFSVGVKAMIINENGQILIIQRSAKVTKAGYFDFPGGRMQFGETLRTAISREIREEIGLKLEKILAPVCITTFIRDIDHSNQIVRIIFPCTASGIIKIDTSEVQDVLWIDKTEFNKYNFADEDFALAFNRISEIDLNSKDFLGLGALEDSLNLLI